MPSSLGIVSSSVEVLADAVLWLDPSRSVFNEQILVNYGTGGSALNAKYGLTSDATGAVIQNGSLSLPGRATSYAFSPHSAVLDITANIDLVCRVALNNWNAAQALMGKGFGNSYYWNIGAGTIGLGISLSSGTVFPSVAWVTNRPANGTTVWVRANRDSTTGVVTFYWATDQAAEPTSWTTIGTITSTAGAILSSTHPLGIGAAAQTGVAFQPAAGNFYRVIIRTLVGGAPRIDVDFSVPTANTSAFLESSTNAAIVIINFGAEISEPKLLTHTGTNYIQLSPGTNRVDVADSPALNIPNDIECVMKCTRGTLVGSLIYYSKGWAGQYNLATDLTGALFWNQIFGGVSRFINVGNIATVVKDADTPFWFKVTRQADIGRIRAYKAPDSPNEPTTEQWIQIFDATVAVWIGAADINAVTLQINRNSNYDGRFYRLIVRNNIGGSPVLDIDFTTAITSGSQTTITANTGQIATVIRPAAGRKTVLVTRPTMLFGADDFLEIADNTLLNFSETDSFTVLAVIRQWGTPTSYGRWVDKKAGGAALIGWSLSSVLTTANVGAFLGDGTNGPSQSTRTFTIGNLTAVSMVVDRATQNVSTFANNNTVAPTSITTLGTMVNNLPTRVGSAATASGNSFQDFEMYAVAIWRRALSANEIATVVARYS